MLRHTAEVCTQHCTDCHQATDEFHELANLFSSFFFFFSSTLSSHLMRFITKIGILYLLHVLHFQVANLDTTAFSTQAHLLVFR